MIDAPPRTSTPRPMNPSAPFPRDDLGAQRRERQPLLQREEPAQPLVLDGCLGNLKRLDAKALVLVPEPTILCANVFPVEVRGPDSHRPAIQARSATLNRRGEEGEHFRGRR